MVANNSIVPLLNDGLVRPLDDLVAKYGQDLHREPADPHRRQDHGDRLHGERASICIYRKDILEKAGLQPPKTYEEVLAAAKVIREKGLMQNPLAANFKPGWDLAAEFVNMYIGYGGEFFEPGSAKLAIDNEKGVKALETMKAMSEYMSPDFMTYNTNAIKPLWEAGQAAILNGWGSRAAAMIDTDRSSSRDRERTPCSPGAPTVGGGTIPAAALWWDGFAIAKNICDEDAEASFRAMVHGIRPEVAKKHAQVAAWLIKGYEPTPGGGRRLRDLPRRGAKPYPMVPYMGLLHTALGDELARIHAGPGRAPSRRCGRRRGLQHRRQGRRLPELSRR